MDKSNQKNNNNKKQFIILIIILIMCTQFSNRKKAKKYNKQLFTVNVSFVRHINNVFCQFKHQNGQFISLKTFINQNLFSKFYINMSNN